MTKIINFNPTNLTNAREYLEETSRMFWSSYCPELQDLTNTAKGVN